MNEKIPVLTFFNNKGGVGKTSLVYHTACMMEDMGLSVLVCDLDPQANLTAFFLSEKEVESIWDDRDANPNTIFRCVRPRVTGEGKALKPSLWRMSSELSLLPGDMALTDFEQDLYAEWGDAQGEAGSPRVVRAFQTLCAFWDVVQMGARDAGARVILVDVGPNLGAINRAALIASDYFVTPLGADIFSLQGLRNLGPTVRRWRVDWNSRAEKNRNNLSFEIPDGKMSPLGYVVNQPGAVYANRPVKSYDRWVKRMPNAYHESVLGENKQKAPPIGTRPESDQEHYLATVKHYRSLVPMAQEARKPIFHLTAADGAVGSHFNAALTARADFKALTEKILQRMKVRIPDD